MSPKKKTPDELDYPAKSRQAGDFAKANVQNFI